MWPFQLINFYKINEGRMVTHMRILPNKLFLICYNEKENPKEQYSKPFPGTRELQNFALPLILTNLVL
jgi:hypothetical protein